MADIYAFLPIQPTEIIAEKVRKVLRRLSYKLEIYRVFPEQDILLPRNFHFQNAVAKLTRTSDEFLDPWPNFTDKDAFKCLLDTARAEGTCIKALISERESHPELMGQICSGNVMFRHPVGNVMSPRHTANNYRVPEEITYLIHQPRPLTQMYDLPEAYDTWKRFHDEILNLMVEHERESRSYPPIGKRQEREYGPVDMS